MQCDRMNNKKFTNWIKTVLSFTYTKEGLVDFADEQVKTLHKNIKQVFIDRGLITATVICKQCRSDDVKRIKDKTKGITRWDIDCGSNICNLWLEEVLLHHARLPYPKIEWANVDPVRWPTHPWEIAKIFQPCGCKKHQGPIDSDLPALLTMMLNCKIFHPLLSNISILHDLRENRNQAMHSNNLEIEDEDMQTIIDRLIDLLEDPIHLHNQPQCQESVRKIKELRDNKLDLSLNQAIKEKMHSMETDIKELKSKVKELNNVTDTEGNPSSLLSEFQNTRENVRHLQQTVTELLADNDNIDSLEKGLLDDAAKRRVDDIAAELRSLADTLSEIYRQLSETIQSMLSKINVLTVSANEQKVTSDKLQKELTTVKHKAEMRDNLMQQLENKVELNERITTEHGETIENMKSRMTDVEKIQTQTVDQFVNLETLYRREEPTSLKEITHKSEECRTQSVSQAITRLQGKLIRRYHKIYDDIPLYQLISEETGKFSNIFVEPKIEILQKDGKRTPYIDKYMFQSNASIEPCQDIYVTGEPGTGKTIFCQYVVLNWCTTKSSQFLTTDNMDLNHFDLLFFIPLRSFNEFADVESMINDLMEEDISNVLGNAHTLIILDGLDEWEPPVDAPTPRYVSKGLPDRKQMKGYTVITTTRPWKLESIRLQPKEIDKHMEILGLDYNSSVALSVKMIALLNNRYRNNKSHEQFLRDIHQKNLKHFLSVPVLLTQLLCLWFSEEPLGDTQCAIYTNIVEQQLQFAKECKDVPVFELNDSDSHDSKLPTCFSGKKNIINNRRAIAVLSRLAFQTLFLGRKESTLVFDQHELCGMSEDLLKMFMKVGLLSQTKVYAKPIKRSKCFSFIHKTHHEFFAALYLVSQGTDSDVVKLLDKLKSTDEMIKQEQFMKFVLGMDVFFGLKLLVYELICFRADFLSFRF